MTGAPTVAVITTVTDGYDILKAVPLQFGLTPEFIALTDGKETAEPDHGWSVLDVNSWADAADRRHPNRLAKIAKCEPWRFTDAPYSIWIDASYRITSSTFAFEAVKFANPIAQFVHPWRNCVYDEAAASVGLDRYTDTWESIRSQSREYSGIGHPPHWGLWATGVIVRKHTSDVREMGSQWLAEIRRHSYQDQISEPVSLRLCDLRPDPLPGDHITNPWLRYEGSARHT